MLTISIILVAFADASWTYAFKSNKLQLLFLKCKSVITHLNCTAHVIGHDPILALKLKTNKLLNAFVREINVTYRLSRLPLFCCRREDDKWFFNEQILRLIIIRRIHNTQSNAKLNSFNVQMGKYCSKLWLLLAFCFAIPFKCVAS